MLVWPEVKDEFVRLMGETIREFYGDDPNHSPDYGRVINSRNFDRLAALLGSGKAVVGGETTPTERYIAPTVLVDVAPSRRSCRRRSSGRSCRCWRSPRSRRSSTGSTRPRPLGLYVFAEDEGVVERILGATSRVTP